MRFVTIAVCLTLLAVPLIAGSIVVRGIQGTVEVRKGVTEQWVTVAVGDLLKPEDTIRTGERSSVVLAVGTNKVTIPDYTMVDLHDFRQMSREDLLLRLATQDILAVPDRTDDKTVIPSATILHGNRKGARSASQTSEGKTGEMLIHGARVLQDYGYYATSVLRIRSTMTLYPEVKNDLDAMIALGGGFEKLNLESEARAVYISMLAEPLPDGYRKRVAGALERLKDR